MTGMRRRQVEELVRAHYRAERGAPDAASKARALAAVRAVAAHRASDAGAGAGSCAVEGASACASGLPRPVADAPARACARAVEGAPSREASFAAFVAAQARFIRPRVWAAQLALVAVMVAACAGADGMSSGFSFASGMLAAATVLVGLPDLLASAAHRVAELEYACRFDCRAVALARLIVLGCSDVAVITVLALAAPVALGADPFASLVHVCVPYFLSCAGALCAARRSPSMQTALPLACAWTLLVMAAAYAAFLFAPLAYAQASAWAWALVAAASLLWAVHEAHAWLRRIAGGIDVLAPDRTWR